MCPQHTRPCDRHGLESLEDPTLHVGEQPVRGVGDARRDRDEQDAGQHVVHVRNRPCVDRAAEHVDEHQHHGDRRDDGRDDGVHAACDMAQGPPRENSGVAEEVRGHPCPLVVRAGGVALAVAADDREEDLLEGRLLLDVLDRGGREEPLELGEGAVHDDPTLVEDRDPVGQLLGLVQVLRGEQHRRSVAA